MWKDERLDSTLEALDAIVWLLGARRHSSPHRHRAVAAQIARTAAEDLRRPQLVRQHRTEEES